MNIHFIDTKVISLSLKRIKTENVDNFKLSFSPAFSDSEGERNTFLIIFELFLKIEDDFNLSVEYGAKFLADDDIDEEFKESHFVKVNAPAIAYPFLRAYIGNFTLNSGFSPIILPTINFTKFTSQS